MLMAGAEVRVSYLACVMVRSGITHFVYVSKNGFNGDDSGYRVPVQWRAQRLLGCYRQGQAGFDRGPTTVMRRRLV